MPDIHHETTIASDPDALFEGLSTQEGLAAFWTDQTEARAEVGSIATFAFGPNRETVFEMRIEALDRPARQPFDARHDLAVSGQRDAGLFELINLRGRRPQSVATFVFALRHFPELGFFDLFGENIDPSHQLAQGIRLCGLRSPSNIREQ